MPTTTDSTPLGRLPQVVSIPLSQLNIPPWNPRKFMDESQMQDLMAYLEKGGLVPRIWVMKGNGEPLFDVISGQRRIEAYRRLGKSEIEAEVMDVSLEEAKILAITSNQDEEMHWWDWVKAIGQVKQEHDWNQRELASHLGCSQTMVSRAKQILEALNPDAQSLLDLTLIKKTPLKTPVFDLSENAVYALTGLYDPKKPKESGSTIEKALRVVLDRRMTEPEVKRLITWVQGGGNPAKYDPTRSKGPDQRIDPKDPNAELWKMLPNRAKIRMKPQGYQMVLDMDRYGAPATVFAALSMDATYSQKVNPQVGIPNPYKDKIEELLEKGVEGAKTVLAQEEKEYQDKQAKKKSPPSRAKAVTTEPTPKETKEKMPSEPLTKKKGGPASPPTEDELKTITDLLGVKNVAKWSAGGIGWRGIDE